MLARGNENFTRLGRTYKFPPKVEQVTHSSSAGKYYCHLCGQPHAISLFFQRGKNDFLKYIFITNFD